MLNALQGPTPGYVYLMHADTGHYKIGFSKRPEERLRAFSTEMPVEIEIVNTFYADDAAAAERLLHQRYKDLRHRGEWFSLDAEAVAFIASIHRFQLIGHYDETLTDYTNIGRFIHRAGPDEAEDVLRLQESIAELILEGHAVEDRHRTLFCEDIDVLRKFKEKIKEHPQIWPDDVTEKRFERALINADDGRERNHQVVAYRFLSALLVAEGTDINIPQKKNRGEGL